MLKTGVVALILLPIAILVLNISGAGTVGSATDPVDVPHVETQNPQRKTIFREFSLPGQIAPDKEVVIVARATGYLEKLNVDIGSRVRRGDVLSVISAPEMEKELDKLAAELAWKESQYDRAAKLFQKSINLVTKDQVDELKGQVEVVRAEKARVEELVNFARVRAPFDGVITERFVDVGDLIKANESKMFTMVKADVVRVRAYIPETEVAQINGNVVKITIDELPGRVFDAKVSRHSWGLDSGTKTMQIEADIANKDYLIRPGMFARLKVDLDAHENTLVIPAQALILKKKKTFVYVVRNGVIEEVPVKVGLDDGIELEILGGLMETDEVVVGGKSMAGPGEKVRSTRTKSE